MDAAGVLDERYDEVDDIVRARKVPSLQLTGSTKRKTLDLNALTSMGVKLIGRFSGIQDGKGQYDNYDNFHRIEDRCRSSERTKILNR